MPVRRTPSAGPLTTPSTSPVDVISETPREVEPGEVSLSPGVDAVDTVAWRELSQGNPSTQAIIRGFHTSMANSIGRVEFAWEQPGDRIPFEMTVEVHGDPEQVKAEIWTNADNNANPDEFRAVPMEVVRQEGKFVTYRAEIPIHKIGNYRAVGRVSLDGGGTYQWMSDSGIGDIRFRPRSEEHDKLNIEEVSIGHVNFDSETGRPGTLRDMMGSGSPDTNGKYTLEWLAKQGKTAIWMMPPFEITKWEGRPEVDDAGSPYAVKDFFSVRTELSSDAQGLTGEAAETAAIKEFQEFMDKAHELGIKVILDIPLNHVGHNYEFKDLFVRYTEAGREIREVRKNDFSKVAIAPGQLDVIRERLKNVDTPKYMEYIAPWMYGSRSNHPMGAIDVHDKAPGGWFEWHDTAQLNHGRRREHYHWYDQKPTEESRAVQDWLLRVMKFWAVDMKVDGFRLDHINGLPTRLVEMAGNVVQADVDKHRPGTHLFMMGEDFHTQTNTMPVLDNMQGGWFHEFLKARNPGDIERIVESPWFNDLLNLSSHDETRALGHLGNDHRAFARLSGLLQLLGGPAVEVAGDAFGERNQLPFKQYKGIVALMNIDQQGREIAETMGRVGRARQTLPALQDDNRDWLRPRDNSHEPDLLAMGRYPDDPDSPPALVFANMNNAKTRSNVFQLSGETRQRIDPNKLYQAVDLLANDPEQHLWSEPISGKQLLEQGVYAKLSPYQMQMLQLMEVNS